MSRGSDRDMLRRIHDLLDSETGPVQPGPYVTAWAAGTGRFDQSSAVGCGIEPFTLAYIPGRGAGSIPQLWSNRPVVMVVPRAGVG
jgi:hypothetical protein